MLKKSESILWVGALAGVLDIIRDSRINVERMENIIFEEALGA